MSLTNTTQKITPCLWFDGQAGEAAEFYTSLFEDSGVGAMSRYGKEEYEVHGQPEGSVQTVEFELAGQQFVGLNGGPHFSFTPAISFYVVCETEQEVDRLWKELSNEGTPLMELDTYDWSEKYGWLADRYGVSWQVTPVILHEMLKDSDAEKVARVTEAYMDMKKFDIEALKQAYKGNQ